MDIINWSKIIEKIKKAMNFQQFTLSTSNFLNKEFNYEYTSKNGGTLLVDYITGLNAY